MQGWRRAWHRGQRQGPQLDLERGADAPQRLGDLRERTSLLLELLLQQGDALLEPRVGHCRRGAVAHRAAAAAAPERLALHRRAAGSLRRRRSAAAAGGARGAALLQRGNRRLVALATVELPVD